MVIGCLILKNYLQSHILGKNENKFMNKNQFNYRHLNNILIN